MVGKRLPAPVGWADFTPGAYGLVDGLWLVCTPNGLMAVLNAGHTITEHPDGSITVAPSILVQRDESGATWHGYLEYGIWRSV